MSLTALVVEDNLQNSYLVTFLLERAGYAVTHASDGPAALSAVERFTPDVILLDIQLPGMDGYEVARRLRALASMQAVPIVAVTSYAMVGDRERCLTAGCTGYIEKPIDPTSFVAEVAAYCTRTGNSG